MSLSHVLVVDDHLDIREALAVYLKRHDFRVSVAADAAAARSILSQHSIDLIVLDVMMPGEDGLSLCRFVRETCEIPVILLTALADETDRIVGLEIGADDYIVKPFNPRELLARIKNVVRRTRALPRSSDDSLTARLRFDRWIFDPARREIIGETGVGVPLSTAEFRLLSAFLHRPRMVLSRDQLLDLTSGRTARSFDRSIDNQVSRLRRKLEREPTEPALVKTIWGGGYMLAADVVEIV